MKMSSEILRGMDGHIAVTRERGGTLFSDRSSDGGIMPENLIVSMSEKQRSKLDRKGEIHDRAMRLVEEYHGIPVGTVPTPEERQAYFKDIEPDGVEYW